MSLAHWRDLTLKKGALVQQQLPSSPASTKHEYTFRVEFGLHGDVNSNICER